MNHRLQMRAAQDHALRDSLAGSSLSALTLVVATMLAGVLFAHPTRIIALPDYSWDIPVRGDTAYVAAVDLPPVVPTADVFDVRPTEEDLVDPSLEKMPMVEPGTGTGNGEGRSEGSSPGEPGAVTMDPPDVIPPPTDYIPHDEIPVVAHRVVPEYPEMARNAALEGRVMVQIYVGLDGRVRRAEVVGKASIFDDAALTAIRQWVFTPAKANGHPVAVWMAVPVVFRLH
jgi:protein TonB